MSKIYVPILLLLCTFLGINRANSQASSVILTPPSGPTVSYASITSAYAAIPVAPSGNYLIELQSNYLGTDASEVYPIQLTDRSLVAGGFTITIRPAAGFNTAVIKRPVAAAGAVLQMNGGDNIILDGRPGGIASSASNYLSINDAFSGSNTNRNIEILNSANNNLIEFLNINAADATAAGAGNRDILVGSTTSTSNKNNIISDCIVTGGLRGIQDFGLNDATPNTGTIIKNNTVKNFGAIGIFAGSSQSNITIQNNLVQLVNYNVLVTNTVSPFTVAVTGIQQQSLVSGSSNILDNTISMISTSTTVSSLTCISESGIGTENVLRNTITALSTPGSATATSNFIVAISGGNAASTAANTINISKNKISGLSSTGAINFRGMSMFFGTAGSTLNINNNFLSITDPNLLASAIFGILLGTTTGITYTSNEYYNTIRIGGSESNTSTTSAYGIYKSDANAGSTHNIKDNIVLNERTGGVAGTPIFMGFYLGSTLGTLNVDYNTYSSTAATNGYAAGGWDGSIYTNGGLAAYKAGAGTNEQNSNFATVSFVSNTDLHLAAPSITATTLYATPISGITTDIDGDSRSATTPFQGADEPTTPTPIGLQTFTGENRGAYNSLNWSTASEQNNTGFNLERSLDAITFNTIGFVATKATNGNSSQQLNYTFNDEKPLISTSFYRLKQVDKNGATTYSPVVTIKGKSISQLSFSNIYPNPVANQFNLIVSTLADNKSNISIVDMLGKTIYLQTVNLKTGDNIIPINSSNLKTGSYIVSIKNISTGENISKEFVK